MGECICLDPAELNLQYPPGLFGPGGFRGYCFAMVPVFPAELVSENVTAEPLLNTLDQCIFPLCTPFTANFHKLDLSC